jgi:hypothetical protein
MNRKLFGIAGILLMGAALRAPSQDASSSVASATATERSPVQEILRDPFWPVGFFPEGWRSQSETQSEAGLEGSGWKAAYAKINISGTSRLGGKTAAIVNGELKVVGDSVLVLHDGLTYQWEIVGIESDGRIQLKRLGVR